ncbi:MAG: hypothetical protein EBY14_11900 [Betaproteobacteria bacterium]|nr:hypothetical protein [Betaproteobacteria bacterium]
MKKYEIAAMIDLGWMINENALKKLRTMWGKSFEANLNYLLPIFSEHIYQRNLGVAGIKWAQESSD